MHKPVDGAEARAAEIAAYKLLCARLQRPFETAEATDTCTLRAAVKAMLAHSAALVAENERQAAEIARLRGLLIDPGDPTWEDARAVLAAEMRKAGYPFSAGDIEAFHPSSVPSYIALNLIAQAARTALETRNG